MTASPILDGVLYALAQVLFGCLAAWLGYVWGRDDGERRERERVVRRLQEFSAIALRDG